MKSSSGFFFSVVFLYTAPFKEENQAAGRNRARMGEYRVGNARFLIIIMILFLLWSLEICSMTFSPLLDVSLEKGSASNVVAYSWFGFV